ncbi:MAG: radical SAM protein [Candidatus Alcyoniella australis]|nr:radical SAM protein [Candidatus Alcyoniella australis]
MKAQQIVEQYDRPRMVMIQTTGRCNSSCVICPYPKLRRELPQGEMDQGLFEDLLAQCAQIGGFERAMVYLMNEPLLDPLIVERIDAVKAALPEAKVHILTNGAALTPRLSERLLESGLDWIGFSVHANTTETYRQVCGRKDFAIIRGRIVNFIQRAQQLKDPNYSMVNIYHVRPYVSDAEFDQAAQFWRDQGVQRLDLYQGYVSRAGNVEVFGHKPLRHDVLAGCRTVWAYRMLHVLHDGSVIPCCMDWARSEIWGDLNKRSVLDIWRGPERLEFLRRACGQDDADEDFICLHCEDAIAEQSEQAEQAEQAKQPTDEAAQYPAAAVVEVSAIATAEGSQAQDEGQAADDKQATDDEQDPCVLLLQLPPWLPANPPLGLACLSRYCADAGFRAEVFDLNIELYGSSDEPTRQLWQWERGVFWEDETQIEQRFGAQWDRWAQRVLDHPAQLIGISAYDRRESAIVLLVRRLRQAGEQRPIVLGGPGVLSDKLRQLYCGRLPGMIDGFVLREGEQTLVEICRALEQGRDFDGLPGVLTVDPQTGEERYTPRAALAADQIPSPTFDGFDVAAYTDKSLGLEWSRGCLNACAFCQVNKFWRGYRAKPAAQAVAEIVKLHRRHGIEYFSLADSLLNGDAENLAKIADGLIDAGLPIRWSAGIAIHPPLPDALFDKLARSGCFRLEFGLESGSDRVLKLMGKRNNGDDAARAVRLAHATGIEAVLYLIVGYPGETEDDVDQTIDWLERNAQHVDLVRSLNGLIILDDSPLFKKARSLDIEMPDCSEPGWGARWAVGENTPETRVARIDRVRAALERLGVPVEFSNRDEVLPTPAFIDERIAGISTRLDQQIGRLNNVEASIDRLLQAGPRPIRPGYGGLMLVLPPVWGTQMPPLGLAYVAAFVQSQGYDPLIWDLNAYMARNVEDRTAALWQENNFRNWTDVDRFPEVLRLIRPQLEAAAERIVGTGRRVIAFSVYSPNRAAAIELARMIRQRAPDRVIIAGGRGVTTHNERLLFPPDVFDALVVGEGETAIVPLIEAIFDNRDIEPFPGVVVPGGEAWTELTPREPCDDLALLPFPTYEGFDIGLYGEPEQEPELPLLFSRSCIKRCAFCNDHGAMGRFRARPPEHMLAEIRYHVTHNGRRRFRFNDQLINGDLRKLERLCELLIDSGLGVEWIALAAPRGEMSAELFAKMRAAGCYTLNFGVESGSDKVLKAMNKGFSTDDAARSIQRARQAGINTMLNFIVGFPGETEQDFELTMRFIEQHREHICGITSVNSLILLEGSPIFDDAERHGIVLPKRNADLEWFIPQLNTPQMRRERAQRLVQKIRELDLHFLVSNLEERVDDPTAIEARPDADQPCGPSEPEEPCAVCDEQPASPGMRPGEQDPMRDQRGTPRLEQIDKGPFDVLLLLPPVWGVGVAPLGIAYLEQALLDAGIKVGCLDLNIKLYNRTDRPELWTMESYKAWTDPEQWRPTVESMSELFEHYLDQILAVDAPIIGLSTFTSNIEVALEIARRIKQRQPKRTLIFGGPGMSNSFEPNRIGPENGDFVIFGEAEHSLVQLVRALLGEGFQSGIEGVRRAGDTADVLQIERSIVLKPGELQFPRFHSIRLEEYSSRAAPLLASRGCVRRCTFCNDHHIYRKYRGRSAQDVFDEIRFHFEQGRTEFTFNDVLINGNVRELRGLCKLIVDAGMEIHWGGQGVVRKEMDFETLSLMRAAGCMSMVYGVESFSDKVLKLMNKPYTKAMCIDVLGATRQAGMEAIINIIVGFPGETEDDFRETYDFLIEHRGLIDQVASISPCLVNLGAPLQRDFQKYGIVFPKDEPSVKWSTADGENTFEVRRRRLLRITNLVAEWDKSIHTINLYDDERDNLREIEASEGISKQAPRERLDESSGPLLLLSMAPPWGVEFPPLGLAALATSAREAGHAVSAYDLNMAMYDAADEQHRSWWQLEHLKFWEEPEHLQQILRHTADVFEAFVERAAQGEEPLVGLTVHAGNFRLSMRLIELIKKSNPQKKVLLGGPGVFFEADRRLIPAGLVDGIVVGEGEATLNELLDAFKAHGELRETAGLLLKDKPYSERQPIRPLEELPTPLFEDFDLDLYQSNKLPVMFGRGCIGKCAFCNDHQLIAGYRMKRPETMLREIMHYSERYTVGAFAFNDLILNASRPRLLQFARLVIDADLSIRWTGQAVIDPQMTVDDFALLKRAGCDSLVFGVESFSDRVLTLMGKRFSGEQALQCLERCRQGGVEAHINLIVGFPGEGRQDFAQTLEALVEHSGLIDRVSAVSTCIIVPSCDLERNPERYDIVLPDEHHWRLWRTSDNQNTYEIRRERLVELIAALDRLGIEHGMHNLYLESLDEDEPQRPDQHD